MSAVAFTHVNSAAFISIKQLSAKQNPLCNKCITSNKLYCTDIFVQLTAVHILSFRQGRYLHTYSPDGNAAPARLCIDRVVTQKPTNSIVYRINRNEKPYKKIEYTDVNPCP